MLTEQQLSDEQIRLGEMAQAGEFLQEFKDSKFWPAFNSYILEEMDRESYNWYCENLNPENSEKDIVFKVQGVIVRKIRQRIDMKINEGKLARQTLNTTHEEEGVLDE